MVSGKKSLEHHFGPAVYFRMVRELWEGKQYLTWDDWDVFFSLAEEHGMLSGIVTPRGRIPRFPAIERNLVHTWRRVREAKAAGMSAWDFAISEKARVAREHESDQERMQRYEQERLSMKSSLSGEQEILEDG